MCIFLTNELDWNDLFYYLSNETFNQIEQKIDHLDQNGQWFISKWNI